MSIWNILGWQKSNAGSETSLWTLLPELAFSGAERRLLVCLVGLAFLWPAVCRAETPWQPVPGKMMTRWGREVTPKKVWPEYPRPQFKRTDWQNLNGLWDYAISAKDASQPADWAGKILVPFAVESTLSGVGHLLSPDEALSDHGEANQAAIAELEPVAEEITADTRTLGIVQGFNDSKNPRDHDATHPW